MNITKALGFALIALFITTLFLNYIEDNEKSFIMFWSIIVAIGVFLVNI